MIQTKQQTCIENKRILIQYCTHNHFVLKSRPRVTVLWIPMLSRISDDWLYFFPTNQVREIFEPEKMPMPQARKLALRTRLDLEIPDHRVDRSQVPASLSTHPASFVEYPLA